MISSEREVAIDEVNETCIRAADHYEKFDELIDDAELSGLLGDLAERRRRFARRLQEQIRDMDHLPSTPDPDREGLERLAARFRAALSGEGAIVLGSKCREIEEELIGCIDEALQYGLPDTLRELMEEIRRDAESAHRKMGERLRGLEGG